jgi:hypothetical protein
LVRLSNPDLLSHIPPDGVESEFLAAMAALNAEARVRERQSLLNRLSPSQWSEDDKRRLRADLSRGPSD